MTEESNNMGPVPYNFDPLYSVKDINSCQLLINETAQPPPPFLYNFKHFFRTLTFHLKHCFYFLSKCF